MKREIKFRAWSRDGEFGEDDKPEFKMLYPENLAFSEYDILANQLKDIPDQFYLMQFTGLYDKYGKEIYEGDILEYFYIDKNEPYSLGNVQAVINFEHGAFRCREVGFDYEGKKEIPMLLTDFIDDIEIEIIGNIHENPELL